MNKSLEKITEMFTNSIVSKIRDLDKNQTWNKPWFDVALRLPRNFKGKAYSGVNLYLMYVTQKKNYELPIYMTFNQCNNLNSLVNKGATSYPIVHYSRYAMDKNKKIISIKDYNQLAENDKEEYTLKCKITYHNVFNVGDTTLKQDNPKLWEYYKKEFDALSTQSISDNIYTNSYIDNMLEGKQWDCRIETLNAAKGASYNPNLDKIVLPTKERFFNQKEFYYTLLHEMAHSTGHSDRLNREMVPYFTNVEKYAKEELIAELSSATLGSLIGLDLSPQQNNATYLRSWLSAIDKDVEYLSATLVETTKIVDYVSSKLELTKDIKIPEELFENKEIIKKLTL